jgi:hypothetical protein
MSVTTNVTLVYDDHDAHEAFLKDLHSDPVLGPTFCGDGRPGNETTDLDFDIGSSNYTLDTIRDALEDLRDRHPAVFHTINSCEFFLN